MEGAVGLGKGRGAQAQQLAQGFFSGVLGNGGVEAAYGLAQTAQQQHIAERLPLCCWFTGGQLGAGERCIAQRLEPAEGRLFDDGFVEGHGQSNLCIICTGCLWVLLALHEGNCAVPLGW